MVEIVTFIVEHWVEIGQLILTIIGGASIIVKWTPTLKDDEILGKIKNIISKYIALNK